MGVRAKCSFFTYLDPLERGRFVVVLWISKSFRGADGVHVELQRLILHTGILASVEGLMALKQVDGP